MQFNNVLQIHLYVTLHHFNKSLFDFILLNETDQLFKSFGLLVCLHNLRCMVVTLIQVSLNL